MPADPSPFRGSASARSARPEDSSIADRIPLPRTPVNALHMETLFRPFKRRKISRPRSLSPPPDESESTAFPAVRQPRRRGGIEFTATESRVEDDTPKPEADEPDMASRFAPQTGQIADVNTHMWVSHAHLKNSLIRVGWPT